MARYIPVGEPVNRSEEEGLRQLRDQLPEHYIIIGNFELQPPQRRNTLEYDAVVIGDGGVYAVEIKGWSGEIRADPRRWHLEWGRVVNPFILTEKKAKALRDLLARNIDGWPEEVFCEAVVFLPSPRVSIEGDDARHERLVRPDSIVEFFVERPKRRDTQKPAQEVSGELRERIRRLLVPIAEPRSTMAAIPDYEVEGELERGSAMYREFVGRHRLLRSRGRVRIKAYYLDMLLDRSERDATYRRVLRDIDALEALGDNPFIATAYEPIRDRVDDMLTFYVIMEWVGARTLGDYIEEHQGEAGSRAWEYARHLLGAVSFMHQRGIVHRNLHPGVVYLSRSTRMVPLKIADFDVARIDQMESIADGLPTIGTEGYRAPELLLGAEEYDQRVDVFSLGLILFELLTGHSFYEGEVFNIMHHARIWGEKCELVEDPEVRRALELMLELDPERRAARCEDVMGYFGKEKNPTKPS